MLKYTAVMLMLLMVGCATLPPIKDVPQPRPDALTGVGRLRLDVGNRFTVVNLSIIQNRILRHFFPKATLYSAKTYNHALNPGPNAVLIIDGGAVQYIDSDKDAAALLSEKQAKVRNASQAKTLLLAFAELRGYKLILDPRNELPPLFDTDKDAKSKFLAKWRFNLRPTKDGWTSTCVFKVDNTLMWYNLYQISITSSGNFIISEKEEIVRWGAYM